MAGDQFEQSGRIALTHYASVLVGRHSLRAQLHDRSTDLCLRSDEQIRALHRTPRTSSLGRKRKNQSAHRVFARMLRYGIFRHLSVLKTQTRAYWGSGMAYGIKLKVWGGVRLLHAARDEGRAHQLSDMVSTAATMASGISSSLMSSRTVVPEWKGWPRPVIQLRAGDPTKDVRLEGRAPSRAKLATRK